MERPPQPRCLETPEKLVEIPTGFTNAARKEKAESILSQLQNNPSRSWLERTLYTYLTERVSREELETIEASFKKFGGREQYYENLRKVAQNAALQQIPSINDVAWFTLDNRTKPNRKLNQFQKSVNGEGVAVAVTPKEYFTVPISKNASEEAFKDILRFQDSLPLLAKEFRELSEAEDDSISFKIPGNLQYFIKHPDSLVVHYYNPALSEKIREIVGRHLGSIGLNPTREGRAESGFDFSSHKGQYDGSHSQLLSSIAADRMIELVKEHPKMAQSKPEEVVAFLDRVFAEYGEYSPKEVLQRLEKLK